MANTLTQNQRTFCEEYLKSGNASLAYKIAYPSCKSAGAARTGGAKLLTKPYVRTYIDKLNEQSTNANILTITDIKLRYTQMSDDMEIDAHARLKALNSLEKLVGLNAYEQKRIDIELKKLKMEQQKIKKLEKQQEQLGKDGIKIELTGPLAKWGE